MPKTSNRSLAEKVSEILSAPEFDLSKLSQPGKEKLDLSKQRLIKIINQIAYLHNATSQRELATVLQVSQGTITGYVNGTLVSPLQIRPSVFKAIAKKRGISESLLRQILELKDLSEQVDVFESHIPEADAASISEERLFELIDRLPLNSLVQAISRIGNRLSNELNLQSIENSTPEPSMIEPLKPHPGNLQLLELLKARQVELQMDDEEFFQFGGTFFPGGESEFKEVLAFLEEGISPIDPKYLTGGIRRVTGKSAEFLFNLQLREGLADSPV